MPGHDPASRCLRAGDAPGEAADGSRPKAGTTTYAATVSAAVLKFSILSKFRY